MGGGVGVSGNAVLVSAGLSLLCVLDHLQGFLCSLFLPREFDLIMVWN